MVVRHRKPSSADAPPDHPEDGRPRITSRDRLIFNCFRAVVGVGVLGLIVAMYAAALPLLLDVHRSSPAESTDDEANSTASAGGWKLWTAQDSEAVRGMAVISSVQACMLAVGFFCFRRQQARGAEAASAKAAALRRDATRRMRKTEKRRVQEQVEQEFRQAQQLLQAKAR